MKKKISLHCISLDPDPWTQMNADPSGSTLVLFRLYDLMYFPRQIRPIFDKTRIGIQFHLHMISTKG